MEHCVAGCKQYTGNEVYHHKDCPHYSESFSKRFDNLQAELEKHRWIPVEERLPEEDYGEYLVIRETYGDEPEITYYLADVPCNGGKHGWGRGMPVTHWKPIILP